MIIRNAWKIQKDVGRSRHGGEGAIENWHIFESEDWQSNLTIIGFDILPPGTSIRDIVLMKAWSLQPRCSQNPRTS